MITYPVLPVITQFNGEQRNLRLATEIIQCLFDEKPVIVIDAVGAFSQQVRMLSGQQICLQGGQQELHQRFGDSPFYLFEIQSSASLSQLLDSLKFHCNHLADAVICLVDYDQLPGYLLGGERLLSRLQTECRAQVYLTLLHPLLSPDVVASPSRHLQLINQP